MLFNSIEFALFFPIVTFLFFALPHRYRWLLLLLASCFFYMFFRPIYILILFFTIVIDYYAGIWISNEADKKRKKWLLALSIVANVGVLVVFKYYNFLTDNFNFFLAATGSETAIPYLDIILPIGLSFHTFQAMSYTIEVYRGNQKPEKHFGIYALYVMFYPQLVAGPIERPQNILHQFHEKKVFSYENMRVGFLLIAWGLFKKVVIADRLAQFTNQVYGSPEQYSGIPLIIGTVCFAFQIFCDFSGYSDIAIGSARCMGYDLMKNFDRPYLATTISEFWRRWHISLSTWFRDYLYIPLGGNRVSKPRMYLNLFIVFLLSGVWHGANWTFVIWGALHGVYLVVESEVYRRYPGLKAHTHWAGLFLSRSLVFLLVIVAWVFFRAKTVNDSFYIIAHMFSGLIDQISSLLHNVPYAKLELLYLGHSGIEFFGAMFLIGLLMTIHYLQGKKSFEDMVLSQPALRRWTVYYLLVISVVFFGVFNRSEFIYFQF